MMWKAWGGDEGVAWAERKAEAFETARENAGAEGSGPFDHRALGEGVTDAELGHAPDWDRPLLEMYRGVSDPDTDPSRTLVSFASSETPEFVLDRIRDAIRGGALFSDIDGVSGADLMDFRQEFADSLARDDFTLEDVTETIQEFTGESREQAEVAARTEVGNALKQAREEGYEDRGEGDELFYWSGTLDGRQTDTCAYLMAGRDAVDENPGAFAGLPHQNGTNPFHGGEPVSMDELKDHVERVANADPEINTEPRTWTPHIQCRSSFVKAPANWRDL